MNLTVNTISDIAVLLMCCYRRNARQRKFTGIEDQFSAAVYSAENSRYKLITAVPVIFYRDGGSFLVSLDVEKNPRFYRGKKSERSDNRKGELDASRKTLKREEPPV